VDAPDMTSRQRELVQFHPMQHTDLVRHRHWPLQPEVVRGHDLQQLEELGLIATAAGRRSMTFWPTIHGRAAVKDAPGYLERLAREVDDEGDSRGCGGGRSGSARAMSL
jgi:hypothetical protein